MSTNNQQIEKIARMAAFEIPAVQIARAMGLTEGRISQIISSDEYKIVLAEVSTQFFEQNQTLNDGWDTIEAKSLDVLMTNLQWNNDPDFALKAAAMANRANRRGSISNRMIDGQMGARAVFHLTANFIDKLQQINVTEKATNGAGDKPTNGEDKSDTPSQKQSDYMVPEQVEKLFMAPEKERTDALLSFFPDFAEAAPAE